MNAETLREYMRRLFLEARKHIAKHMGLDKPRDPIPPYRDKEFAKDFNSLLDKLNVPESNKNLARAVVYTARIKARINYLDAELYLYYNTLLKEFLENILDNIQSEEKLNQYLESLGGLKIIDEMNPEITDKYPDPYLDRDPKSKKLDQPTPHKKIVEDLVLSKDVDLHSEEVKKDREENLKKIRETGANSINSMSSKEAQDRLLSPEEIDKFLSGDKQVEPKISPIHHLIKDFDISKASLFQLYCILEVIKKSPVKYFSEAYKLSSAYCLDPDYMEEAISSYYLIVNSVAVVKNPMARRAYRNKICERFGAILGVNQRDVEQDIKEARDKLLTINIDVKDQYSIEDILYPNSSDHTPDSSEYLYSCKDNVLVERLLLKSGLYLIAASPKSYKSLIMYHLAYCICSGVPFMNKFRVRRGKVLFVQCEEPADTMKNRLISHGFSPNDPNWSRIKDNIKILRKFDITSEKDMDSLQNVIHDFQPSLIIFDTLRAITSNSQVSENSADFGKYLYNLQRLCISNDIAGMVIHHKNKVSPAGTLDSVAGSSSIPGGTDGIWLLSRSNINGEDVLVIKTIPRDMPSYSFAFVKSKCNKYNRSIFKYKYRLNELNSENTQCQPLDYLDKAEHIIRSCFYNKNKDLCEYTYKPLEKTALVYSLKPILNDESIDMFLNELQDFKMLVPHVVLDVSEDSKIQEKPSNEQTNSTSAISEESSADSIDFLDIYDYDSAEVHLETSCKEDLSKLNYRTVYYWYNYIPKPEEKRPDDSIENKKLESPTLEDFFRDVLSRTNYILSEVSEEDLNKQREEFKQKFAEEVAVGLKSIKMSELEVKNYNDDRYSGVEIIHRYPKLEVDNVQQLVDMCYDMNIKSFMDFENYMKNSPIGRSLVCKKMIEQMIYSRNLTYGEYVYMRLPYDKWVRKAIGEVSPVKLPAPVYSRFYQNDLFFTTCPNKLVKSVVSTGSLLSFYILCTYYNPKDLLPILAKLKPEEQAMFAWCRKRLDVFFEKDLIFFEKRVIANLRKNKLKDLIKDTDSEYKLKKSLIAKSTPSMIKSAIRSLVSISDMSNEERVLFDILFAVSKGIVVEVMNCHKVPPPKEVYPLFHPYKLNRRKLFPYLHSSNLWVKDTFKKTVSFFWGNQVASEIMPYAFPEEEFGDLAPTSTALQDAVLPEKTYNPVEDALKI